jgi:predicted DNA binding protein
MVTIVRGTVPASEFALSHAPGTVPDLEFEIERIVEGGDRTVMPLLWVWGADVERASEAFAADQTVESADLLASFDGEQLYRMEWVDHIDLVLRMLVTSEATILDAHGTGERWRLKVIYPTRDELSATHEFCRSHGLSFDVERIREPDGEPAGRYGLTTAQFEALTTAAEMGWFAVPREVALDEIATEFDVSDQAMSERLRRGLGALVEDTLLVSRSTETRRSGRDRGPHSPCSLTALAGSTPSSRVVDFAWRNAQVLRACTATYTVGTYPPTNHGREQHHSRHRPGEVDHRRASPRGRELQRRPRAYSRRRPRPHRRDGVLVRL